MSSHPEIDAALRSASAYRVLKSARPGAWNVWRFRPWSSPACGWRIIVADVKSREDGWATVAHQLGLTLDPAPQPLPPAEVNWTDHTEWI